MGQSCIAARTLELDVGDRPGLEARMVAARLLGAVIDKQVSADGLTDDAGGHPQYLALSPRDRSLVRAILSSALRHRMAFSRLVSDQIDRPLPQNAHSLGHLLHVALAQMLVLDVPDHAAIDLAVENAANDPRTRRFTKLVNAVLRSIGRRNPAHINRVLEETVNAPEWFEKRISEIYGDETAAEIFAMHRRLPPTDFTTKNDPEKWAKVLGGFVLPTGTVRVEKTEHPIGQLPGYEEGAWWVQDAAAALPARLFGEVKGLRIADLCAAPGGKTAQLAAAGARVTAVDISKNRLRRLKSNLERLKLDVEIVQADLGDFHPQDPFDAVLLDAPCSSTGTVRRHPDVPWTKSREDIDRLAEVQLRMLEQASRLVKPGGAFVFSNCSLDPIEGEDLVRRFLRLRDDFRIDPLSETEFPVLEPFITDEGWLRTTPAGMDAGRPEISGMDGFFAVRLVREAS